LSHIREVYRDATYETTPEFTFNGQRHMVKILRIIDGDTVDIALYHPESQQMYRHRVRLYGIDTPEKRPPKGDPLRHLEIEASHRAKQALESCIAADGIVEALFYKADKYGRLLCTFYDAQGRDLNQWMIANGYATAYFGKTKKKFESSEVAVEDAIIAASIASFPIIGPPLNRI
jgi:micrococcal nuclease